MVSRGLTKGFPLLILGAISLMLCGCGASQMGDMKCNATAEVVPTMAVADHNNLPPANQIQFSKRLISAGDKDNCGVPEAACAANWTTSDTANTRIDVNGVATCVNATSTPATIRETCPYYGVTPGPATLTCN